jgi:hypothetical protein
VLCEPPVICDVHVLHRDVEVVGHLHGEGRQEALADVLAGALGVYPVIGLDLNLQVVHRRGFASDECVGEVRLIRDLIGLRREGLDTIGDSQASSDRQGWPGDQETFQDLATSDRSLQSGHSSAPSSCGSAVASGHWSHNDVKGRDASKSLAATGWADGPALLWLSSVGLPVFSGSQAGGNVLNSGHPDKCAQFGDGHATATFRARAGELDIDLRSL